MYSHIRLYRSRGISPDVSSWYAVDAAALHGLTYDLNQLAVSRTIVDDLLIHRLSELRLGESHTRRMPYRSTLKSEYYPEDGNSQRIIRRNCVLGHKKGVL